MGARRRDGLERLRPRGEAQLAEGAVLPVNWGADDQRRDAELVRACLGGDQAAWDSLVERYAGLVYTVASACDLPPATRDLVFEAVFIRLCDELPRLQDRPDLGRWLVTITDQECRHWDGTGRGAE